MKGYYESYSFWYAPTTIDRRFPIISKALGTELYDINGKRYLDFFSQVGVTNVGHNHPVVVEAVKKQAEKLMFVASQDMGYWSKDVSPIHLAEELRETIPFSVKFIPEVSGATAINAAVKLLLRLRPERKIFLAFKNAFHGRHGYALDLTFSKAVHKKHFPKALDVYHTAFPINDSGVNEFQQLLNYYVDPNQVNALVFEPIQGEGGGMEAANKSALQKIISLCKENNILIIVDEIQSGCGRSGKWWAFEHYDFQPDIICIGKAIANGLPMAMVAYKRELEQNKLEQSWHSSTYAGGPIPVAAALAVLKVIKKEGLVANAFILGGFVAGYLNMVAALAKRKANLKVKGFGLMQGVEFQTASKFYPYPELKEKVFENSLKNGLKLLTAGENQRNPTLRFEPPLNISLKHLEEGLEIFKNAVLKSI